MFLKMVMKIVSGKLDGKKTYIVALGKIMLGICGFIYIMYTPEAESAGVVVNVTPDQALEMLLSGYSILSGAANATTRLAISKKEGGKNE